MIRDIINFPLFCYNSQFSHLLPLFLFAVASAAALGYLDTETKLSHGFCEGRATTTRASIALQTLALLLRLL